MRADDTSGIDAVRRLRLPFAALGYRLGWIEPAVAEWLLAREAAFKLQGGTVMLHADSPAQLGALLGRLALQMRDDGWVKGWRNEAYTCFAPAADGSPDLDCPLFALERAAFRRFGLTSRAVHVNGHTASGELWIGRRSAHKAIDPGLLDNLAAGGISAGETAEACVVRELAEEAGVPAALAAGARPAGLIRETRCEPDGTHDEVLYCFDLLLPDDFVPNNQDGEVAGFLRLPFAAASARLADMTLDAAAVSRAFLRRHGASGA